MEHHEHNPGKPDEYYIWYDDPAKEDPHFGGKMQEFGVPYDSEHMEDTISLAILMASKTLPPGTIFEIRGKRLPRPGGVLFLDEAGMIANYGICWIHERSMNDDPEPLMDRVPISEAIPMSVGESKAVPMPVNKDHQYTLIARLQVE